MVFKYECIKLNNIKIILKLVNWFLKESLILDYVLLFFKCTSNRFLECIVLEIVYFSCEYKFKYTFGNQLIIRS